MTPTIEDIERALAQWKGTNGGIYTVHACAVDLHREFFQGAADKVFEPHWPEGLSSRECYTLPCDDKGRNGGSWLRVVVGEDGDVWLTMQDWEEMPQGRPDPIPSLRCRTFNGGGRNGRTHQALLWLAQAIRLDEAERRGARPSQAWYRSMIEKTMHLEEPMAGPPPGYRHALDDGEGHVVEVTHPNGFVPMTPQFENETRCTVPPKGWFCTRRAGHEGPCAAWPCTEVV